MELKMSRSELERFLEDHFPQVAGDYQVVEAEPSQTTVRAEIGHGHLRPGGTVSGPTIFSLANVTIYLAVLARIGPEALAVTTNCAIDFMRKPAADRDLLARGRILKLGRVLAVGDVLIWSEGLEQPVARASLTYAIPPRRELTKS